jgi:putative membrane protein
MAVLNNQGSTARDHLANERTFLAWVRTALGIVGLGVAVVKLGGSSVATVEGTGLAVYGVGILVYAIVRFGRVSGHLKDGRFPVAKRGPVLIGVLGVVLALGALALVALS